MHKCIENIHVLHSSKRIAALDRILSKRSSSEKAFNIILFIPHEEQFQRAYIWQLGCVKASNEDTRLTKRTKNWRVQNLSETAQAKSVLR